MVNIEDLYPGMRVKIVDEWCKGCIQNINGAMDKWLGEIVTIRNIIPRGGSARFYIEEDDQNWVWNPYMVEYIGEESMHIVPASNDEILSLLNGVV